MLSLVRRWHPSLPDARCRTSIRPQRLGIDRADCADHLRETNKEQLLLNIVALRYGDAPLFLEVSSVISHYTREGSASASARIDPSPQRSAPVVTIPTG